MNEEKTKLAVYFKSVKRAYQSTTSGYIKPCHHLSKNRDNAKIESELNKCITKVKYENIYFYDGREIFLKSERWNKDYHQLVQYFVYNKEFIKDKYELILT